MVPCNVQLEPMKLPTVQVPPHATACVSRTFPVAALLFVLVFLSPSSPAQVALAASGDPPSKAEQWSSYQVWRTGT